MQSALKRDTTHQNKRAVIFSLGAMGDLFSYIFKYLLKGKICNMFPSYLKDILSIHT